MTRLHYLLAIDRTQRAGFHRFAAALAALYRRDFPPSPSSRVSL